MKSFDTRVYSISDFLEWRKNNVLDISPNFQRRGVWTRVAKSFLIDTIVRGQRNPALTEVDKCLLDSPLPEREVPDENALRNYIRIRV